jgi:hypothetical protein
LIGKGIGYILFKDRDSVLPALSLHESLFKKRSLRVTICGKTSKRIKQIARGEDVSKNTNFNNRTPAKRSAPNNTGSASVKRKREDDTDDKNKKQQQRPAFMSRKSDEEVDINAKNANKRINLKVYYSTPAPADLCFFLICDTFAQPSMSVSCCRFRNHYSLLITVLRDLSVSRPSLL